MLVSTVLVMDSSALAAKASGLSAGGLEALSVSGGVQLSWDEPVDLAEQVTGYRILRRSPSLGESRLSELVADTESTLTAYLDTEVVSATVYIYRVVALRGGAAAPRSMRARLTYQASAVSPETSQEVSLSQQQEGCGQLSDDTNEPEWTLQQLSPTGPPSVNVV